MHAIIRLRPLPARNALYGAAIGTAFMYAVPTGTTRPTGSAPGASDRPPGSMEEKFGMTDPEDPAQVARLRYELYVETLRARVPQEQFDLLMKIMRMWAESGDGTVRLKHDSPEKELFTPELQQEFLSLMGLIGATRPGHEDQADHVVAQLGDGEHSRGAMSLVPPEVAADPAKLRAMRDELESKARRRNSDQQAVEGIAQASGMSTTDPDDD